MEKAREYLENAANGEESRLVSQLAFPPHHPNQESSFYEYLALRGVRVDRFQPGSFSCSFQVPSRLTDSNGNLAAGAIANLVDLLGGAVIYEEREGVPLKNVSVDISISYISSAKTNDELEIISRCLGKKGYYSGTIIVIRNKTTGEVVAEGRHSLFSKPASKM